MRALMFVSLLGLTLLHSPANAQCGLFGGLFGGLFRGGASCGGGGGGEFYGGGGYYGGGWSGGYNSCDSGGEYRSYVPGYSYSYSCDDGGQYTRPAPAPAPDLKETAVIYLQGLPPDASLQINGKDYTKPNLSRNYRTFVSHDLKRGYSYDYTFVIKYSTTDGSIATGSHKVTAVGGDKKVLKLSDFQYQVASAQKPGKDLPDLTPPTLRKDPATLEWDMPREARIYLDNKLVEAADKREIRRVKTPPLDPNKKYTWDVVVEYETDDHTVTLSQSVKFKAGDKLVMGIGKESTPKLVISNFPERVQLASTPNKLADR